jgi:hypothetical protein
MKVSETLISPFTFGMVTIRRDPKLRVTAAKSMNRRSSWLTGKLLAENRNAAVPQAMIRYVNEFKSLGLPII